MLAHEVFQYIQIEHHAQEDEEGEDDKVLHRLAIRLLVVVALVAGKDKRLVGIAEGLDEHHHHHGYLEARPVDTQLLVGIRLVFKQEGEEDLICRLVEDARYTQEEDGERIAKYRLQQREVRSFPEGWPHIGQEQQEGRRRRNDIGRKDIAYAIVRYVEPIYPPRMTRIDAGTNNQQEDVQSDVEKYVEKSDAREVPRQPLVSQVGKRDAAERIHRHDARHHRHIFRMLRITDALAYRLKQQHHQDKKEGRGNGERRQHGAIHPHRLLFFLLVDEAEEARLHPVGQDDQQECRPSVEVRNDTEVARIGEDAGVHRHQHPIKEAAYDAAQPIDRRFFGKLFQTHFKSYEL